jgi:hypothetical protein
MHATEKSEAIASTYCMYGYDNFYTFFPKIVKFVSKYFNFLYLFLTFWTQLCAATWLCSTTWAGDLGQKEVSGNRVARCYTYLHTKKSNFVILLKALEAYIFLSLFTESQIAEQKNVKNQVAVCRLF